MIYVSGRVTREGPCYIQYMKYSVARAGSWPLSATGTFFNRIGLDEGSGIESRSVGRSRYGDGYGHRHRQAQAGTGMGIEMEMGTEMGMKMVRIWIWIWIWIRIWMGLLFAMCKLVNAILRHGDTNNAWPWSPVAEADAEA